MRAKQNQTSLPFLVLISQLCHQPSVPFVAKTYTKVSQALSNDIQRIEAEYTKDEAERRKKARVDNSSVVDVEAMEADTKSTPALQPTGIPSSSTSTASVPATTSHTPLPQAMIFKMGNLAYSADMRASRMEIVVPSMID